MCHPGYNGELILGDDATPIGPYQFAFIAEGSFSEDECKTARTIARFEWILWVQDV
jgi:hypothetical protein